MIGIPVLAVSLAAFILEIYFLFKYKRYRVRSGITAGEVARHVLASGGHSHMTVECLEGKNQFRPADLKRFFLNKSIYGSRNLIAVAKTARQAVMDTRMISTFASSKTVWHYLRLLIPAAWIALLINSCKFHYTAIDLFVGSVFGLSFILAFLDLPRDWEASEQTFHLLKQSGYFEVDELVRLKSVLRALRFDRLAQIFKSPFEIVTAAWPGKKKNGP